MFNRCLVISALAILWASVRLIQIWCGKNAKSTTDKVINTRLTPCKSSLWSLSSWRRKMDLLELWLPSAKMAELFLLINTMTAISILLHRNSTRTCLLPSVPTASADRITSQTLLVLQEAPEREQWPLLATLGGQSIKRLSKSQMILSQRVLHPHPLLLPSLSPRLSPCPMDR